MGCLITGGSGYVGSRLADSLRKNGEEVYIAARVDFDYTDIQPIRDFFINKDINRVVHLAGVVATNELGQYYQSNIVGLYMLLMVCAEQGCHHFTFASTNNVYKPSVESHSEAEPMQPEVKNLYGISKYAGELIVADFCTQRGLGFANVRIGDIYGPGQRYGNLLKVIVRSVKEKIPLKRYGKGVRTRDYIYITDVVNGLSFISKNCLQGMFNLATGQATSINRLLEIANKISEGACGIEDVPCEYEDQSRVVLQVDALKRLGFCTSINIEEGLKKTVMEDNLCN